MVNKPFLGISFKKKEGGTGTGNLIRKVNPLKKKQATISKPKLIYADIATNRIDTSTPAFATVTESILMKNVSPIFTSTSVTESLSQMKSLVKNTAPTLVAKNVHNDMGEVGNRKPSYVIIIAVILVGIMIIALLKGK